jgi:hypothetical protein
MQPAIFTTKTYTGQFATVNWQLDRAAWVVTFWQFGRAIGHVPHNLMSTAVLEILMGGMIWATAAMTAIFEQDVILAGTEE